MGPSEWWANRSQGQLSALKLAERVGFEKSLSGRYFAFNEMPKTDVFTVTYLLSHLEHESQRKQSFTLISLITVWTVWMRFPRHGTNLLPSTSPAPGFRDAARRVVGFHDDGCACRDLPQINMTLLAVSRSVRDGIGDAVRPLKSAPEPSVNNRLWTELRQFAPAALNFLEIS